MTIRKFLHSCIVMEENGKRVLIDPGSFCFVENKITPEDIGPVDVVLITHKHPDHYYPEALKRIFALKPFTIITNREIGAMRSADGLTGEIISAGDVKNVKGFEIRAYEGVHGRIPTEIPQNLAYLINGKILHPGDSLTVRGVPAHDILALPITAPWLRLVDALEFAIAQKPKRVIPIHDVIMKDFMLERIYQMCHAALEKEGIGFRPLLLGEEIEV